MLDEVKVQKQAKSDSNKWKARHIAASRQSVRTSPTIDQVFRRKQQINYNEVKKCRKLTEFYQ